jgi:predicted Rossmann fold nucleotide-binding protein DprA/Smf involved in DNA uptake
MTNQKNVIESSIDLWVNQRTGEIVEASTITKKIGRQGFMIAYLGAILSLLDIGGKTMQVTKYILENMEQNSNYLLITSRELAEKSGASTTSVTKALKELESAGIIKRKTGAIMVNPQLLHKGSEGKEKALMTKFVQDWGND